MCDGEGWKAEAEGLERGELIFHSPSTVATALFHTDGQPVIRLTTLTTPFMLFTRQCRFYGSLRRSPCILPICLIIVPGQTDPFNIHDSVNAIALHNVQS